MVIEGRREAGREEGLERRVTTMGGKMKEGGREGGREGTYQGETKEVKERQGREAVAAAECAAQDKGVEEKCTESHKGWGCILVR
jgi:hypothetical protein